MLNKEFLLFNSADIYTGASLTLNLVHTIPNGIALEVISLLSWERLSYENFYTAGVYTRPFMKDYRYSLYIDTFQVYIRDMSNMYQDGKIYSVLDTQKNAYIELHLRSGGGDGN